MYYKIIILPIILYIINFLLIKLNFLLDDPTESYHKLEKKFGTPLSGGIFIMPEKETIVIDAQDAEFKDAD